MTRIMMRMGRMIAVEMMMVVVIIGMIMMTVIVMTREGDSDGDDDGGGDSSYDTVDEGSDDSGDSAKDDTDVVGDDGSVKKIRMRQCTSSQRCIYGSRWASRFVEHSHTLHQFGKVAQWTKLSTMKITLTRGQKENFNNFGMISELGRRLEPTKHIS
ncbi:hypothetical protein PoB_002295200 [Plakobranchus ocellatus]|uniref:Uncharacterized protein n=1 Tax=Plakobranchus ocellatus TaxID=259542 RepID=A0AAV3ZP71_9GAST|nr:hypothetical protein PoB_002295200 [Plakobranchus ocellatus]